MRSSPLARREKWNVRFAFEIFFQNRKLWQFEKKPKMSLEFCILTRFVITLVISTPVFWNESIFGSCSVLSLSVAQELLWFQTKFSSLFGFFFCFPLVEIVKNRLTIITNYLITLTQDQVFPESSINTRITSHY